MGRDKAVLVRNVLRQNTMLMTTTECKSLLNITSTVYDSLIETYIPFVWKDIVRYTNNNYIQRKISSYQFVFSTSKTITIENTSTYDFTKEFLPGDTILVNRSYLNDNFYTVSTRSTHVLTVNEPINAENSTDYQITSYIYRCSIPDEVKLIASKMVWFNISNSTNFNGSIASESYGNYSASYRDSGNSGSGIYPQALLSGLKRVTKIW
jgi:hypothetical protein